MKQKLSVLVALLLMLEFYLLGEERTALLIANGNYTAFGKLSTPVAEARELKAVLEGLGFSVTLVADASREVMVDALAEFEASVRTRGGIALFHYGGHGIQVAGKNYLIPVNAEIPDEKRVASRSLDLDEVMAALDASGSGTNIVVLDACRNNPLPATSGRSATRGLAVVGMKPRNSIIIYSAESGSVAQDGLFTPALTRALMDPGLDLNQVIMRVRREVYEASKGVQTPGEYNQLFTPVYLAGEPATLKAPMVSAPDAAMPAVNITRSYGRLSIRTASAGVLYLDGARLAELPEGAEADLGNLTVGEHVVELLYAGGLRESKRIRIEKDAVVSASFGWSQDALAPGMPPSSALASAAPSFPPSQPTDLFEMVQVPGGSYLMGLAEGEPDEGPVHEVRMSPFWMGKHEVTQSLYQRVMRKNPSRFTGNPQRPVEQVSWFEAVEFCNKLSLLAKRKPCYAINGLEVRCDFAANGFRLPTEAEWEYAARGGNQPVLASTNYPGAGSLDAVAWNKGNSERTTHPVGLKLPNALGLYDMVGNVNEWCWDLYGGYLDVAALDPLGSSTGGLRVNRGGGWTNDAIGSRSVERKASDPQSRHFALGFRVVCRP